jgi:hypothetical protein
MRRHDDTARFIERFEALTGFRVHSTSLEGLPREFLARTGAGARRSGRAVRLRARAAHPQCPCAATSPAASPTAGPSAACSKSAASACFDLLDLLEVLAKHGISQHASPWAPSFSPHLGVRVYTAAA